MNKTKEILFAGVLQCLFSATCVYSLPAGYEVASGDVEFIPEEGRLQIRTHSDRTIVNYRDFSVGKQEKVSFVQPSRDSVILNRVTGVDRSTIEGLIEGNGRIFLVNPNGVYFSKDAVVDVGALVVSTMDIQDSHFSQDRFLFVDDPSRSGSIENFGSLKGLDGVALVSMNIRHAGSIQTDGKEIAILSGERVQVAFTDEGLLGWVIRDDLKETLARLPKESNLQDVILKEVVNTDGIIEATQLIKRNGEFILASNTGSVAIEGKLDSSSSEGSGGRITVLAKDISIEKGELNASGLTSGGSVVIGGSPVFAHESTSGLTRVDEDSQILVDSQHGNAGSVLLWSTGDALFDGFIGARSYASGHGGEIETSARNRIGIQKGRVDTSSQDGRIGSWLIDPDSITVATGGVASLSAVAACTDLSSSLTIAPATINSAVSTVTLCALGSSGGTINIQNAINITTPSVGLNCRVQDNGQITVSANVTTNQGAVSFEGPTNITGGPTINTGAGANVTFTDTVNSSTTSALTITAGTGDLFFQGPVGTQNPLGSITATAAGGINLSGNVITNGAAQTWTGPVILESNVNFDSTAGNTTPAGANITFSGSTSTIDGAYTCNVTAGTGGVITVAGAVGGSTPPLSFSMKGSSTSVSANITTSGNTVIFDSPVVLGADVAITDFGLSGVFFKSTVDSDSVLTPRALTVDATLGSVVFSDHVGATRALGNVTATAKSVEQYQNMTLAANRSLSYTGLEQILINGNVSTSGVGTLSFLNPVTFSEASLITAGTGAISFNGMLGSGNLTVNSSGAVNLSAPANHIGRLIVDAASLTVPAASPIFAESLIDLDVTTLVITGNMDVEAGDIILDGTTLTSTGNLSSDIGNITISSTTPTMGGRISLGNGDFSVANNLILGADLSLLSTQGDLTFSGTVNGAFALSAQYSDVGTFTFGDLVGATTPPTGITTNGGRYYHADDVVANGPISITALLGQFNGDIATHSAPITLQGSFEMLQHTVIDTTLSGSGANIILSGVTNSIVNETAVYGLDLNAGTAGSLRIDAYISGYAGSETSVSLAANYIRCLGADSVALSGKLISENEIEISQPITLVNDVKIQASTGPVTINAPIDGSQNLIINSGGLVELLDNIGENEPLTSITVNSDSLRLDNTLIQTKGGDQLYNTPISLTNNVTMNANMSNIILTQAINSSGGNHSMTLNSTGESIYVEGAVGNTTPLSNFSVIAPAMYLFNSITTTGSVTLGSSGIGYLQRSLTITSPDININCTMNNGYNLTLDGQGGSIGIFAIAGNLTPLQVLTCRNASTLLTDSLTLSALVVDDVDTGIFSAPITTSNANGINLSGGTFAFQSDVTTGGGGPLVTSHSGILTFGNQTSLNLSGGFTQTGGGQVYLGGNIYTRSAGVLFSGPVTLTNPITLDTSLGSGNLTFGNSLSGPYDLSLSTSLGDIVFGGYVNNLGEVVIYTANDVDINYPFSCSGFVQETGFGTTTFGGDLTTSGPLGIRVTSYHITPGGELTVNNDYDLIINALYDSIGSPSNPLAIDVSGDLFVGAYTNAYFTGEVDGTICPVRSNPPCEAYLNGHEIDFEDTCPCEASSNDNDNILSTIPSNYLLAQGMNSHDCLYKKDILSCKWYFREPHLQDDWFTKGIYVFSSRLQGTVNRYLHKAQANLDGKNFLLRKTAEEYSNWQERWKTFFAAKKEEFGNVLKRAQVAESASDSWKQFFSKEGIASSESLGKDAQQTAKSKQFFYKGTAESLSSQPELAKEEGWLAKWQENWTTFFIAKKEELSAFLKKMQIAESASDAWKQFFNKKDVASSESSGNVVDAQQTKESKPFFYKGTAESLSSQPELAKEEGWFAKWKKFFMEGTGSADQSKRPNYFAWLGKSAEEEDSQ